MTVSVIKSEGGVETIKAIKLRALTVDPDIQQRAAGVDAEVVKEYAIRYKAKSEMPPIDVFGPHEGKYWVADGFHRINARKQAGFDDIECRIHPGGKNAALWFSCSANAAHGLRRTNDDKAKAVRTALRTNTGKKLSDREVAVHCGVSHPFVSKIRESLETGGEIEKSTERTGRDGRQIDASKESKKRRSEVSKKTAAKRHGQTESGHHEGKASEPEKQAAPAPVTATVNDGRMVDGNGNEVPSELHPVFASVQAFTNLVRGTRMFAASLKTLASGPAGLYLNPDDAAVIEEIAANIEAATPYVVDDSKHGWSPRNADKCAVAPE